MSTIKRTAMSNILHIWSLSHPKACSVKYTICVSRACSHYKRYCCCLHKCRIHHRKIVVKVQKHIDLHYRSPALTLRPFSSIAFCNICYLSTYSCRDGYLVINIQLLLRNLGSKLLCTMMRSEGFSTNPWCISFFHFKINESISNMHSASGVSIHTVNKTHN